MRSLRVFAIGGWLSYRALFNWLNPWIYVPTLLVTPVFEILFFAFLGRTAKVADDTFYVVGNALVSAAVPALFAMTQTISQERYTQTLPTLLASPASRVALFLGRALPVSANGVLVAVFAFVVGSLALHVHVAAAAAPVLLLAIAAGAFSCTGLGLINAALGLRWRENAVLSNLVFALLLIFCGVNIPLHLLPSWMRLVADGLPLTHGIEAARRIVAGGGSGDVRGLLLAELAVGLAYAVAGLTLLRLFEVEARRRATLELA